MECRFGEVSGCSSWEHDSAIYQDKEPWRPSISKGMVFKVTHSDGDE
jgi:hypothetical protein